VVNAADCNQGGFAKPLKRQHFTSARFPETRMLRSSTTKIQGRGSMFEQSIGGSLRNLAIGLVLTAAVVGAGFALAFS
jgi:hypothetical protein